MRDEEFQMFITEFGEATHRVEVPAASVEKWRGKLPDQLLAYWQEEGWCGYADGLFWTVDPDDYEDIVDEWLENSPFEQIDVFHVIARTAFGDLYLWGEKTGSSTNVACVIHVITALKSDLVKKSSTDLTRQARNFFAFSELKYCDLKDESGTPLFKRALAKLGPLAPDEMYGFEPAVVLGGKMQLENLAKVNLDVHLTILRQLAAPSIPFSQIDIDKILSSQK
jgi:hypothetical protein